MDRQPTPDPPAGWIMSTDISHHVSFVDTESGRSLAVTTSTHPVADRWNLTGLAGFENPSPVFVENESFEAAIETAQTIMEAGSPEAAEIEPETRLTRQEDSQPPDQDADAGDGEQS